MAHAQLTEKQRHKFLIPIMMEDITTMNLDDYPDLKLYLTTHTYLKVNKDKNKFLKRVVYAMPIRSLNYYDHMRKTDSDTSYNYESSPITSTQSISSTAGNAQSPATPSSSSTSQQLNRHGVLGENIRNRMAKRYEAQQRGFFDAHASQENESEEMSFQDSNTEASESTPLLIQCTA